MLTRQLIARRDRNKMAVRRRQSKSEVQARFSFLRATVTMGRYKPCRWWQKQYSGFRKWEGRND